MGGRHLAVPDNMHPFQYVTFLIVNGAFRKFLERNSSKESKSPIQQLFWAENFIRLLTIASKVKDSTGMMSL
jgi:hypothetical protein